VCITCLQCFDTVGWAAEEHLAHKNSVGAGVVICLGRSANDLHIVQLMPLPPIISCSIKTRNGSAFLALTYPGCPGKEAIKWT